ncbi:MAG: DUF262 domain-containing protein [Lachnospiraceae bacterium]
MQPYKAWLIQDLIEKNRRVFKIPVYQRNYDWNSAQCEKLFEDIMQAFEEDKKHFTGSVVYIKGESNSSRLDEAMVIDGQQRITTVFILLKVIYDIAVEKNEESIRAELSDYLFNRNCDEQYKLKLKPVKDDNIQFNKMMTGNKDDVDENSNIVSNYRLFKKLIGIQLENGKLLSDILEGMKKLEIVEIVLDVSQGDDPQTIFESINSTGLELSLADLIRNYLLMSDNNQDYLFENYWAYMEKAIGNANLADFFIQYLNMKISDQVTDKNAYAKFKKYGKQFTHEELLKDMKQYSKYYSAFIGHNNNYSYKINRYLLDFRLLDQSTVYTFLFPVFNDHELNIIEDETLEKVLHFFRTYLVRRIICGVPSNSLKGLFKTLHSRLFKDGQSDEYYETICRFFTSLRTKDRMISEDEFRNGLMYGELYRKTKCCKYLLATIENEGSHEVLDTSNMTIEHVLPQKENSVVWQKEIGETYKEVYEKYLHTLGNLTITGYNSELGTKSFVDKKKIIKEYSKANKLNEYILNAEVWNENSIKYRAEKLAEYLANIFNYEMVEGTMDATQNDMDRLSLSDADFVAGTKPINFTFCGETVPVKSYSGMLLSMAKLLFDLDNGIMYSLAKEKFRPTSTDRVYISMTDKGLRRPKEIDNTGIFLETNLSSSDILKFIARIIEEYDFELEEFEFVADRKE